MCCSVAGIISLVWSQKKQAVSDNYILTDAHSPCVSLNFLPITRETGCFLKPALTDRILPWIDLTGFATMRSGAIVLSVLTINLNYIVSGNKWAYTGEIGPENWGREYPHCDGTSQSPINIDTSAVTLLSTLGQLVFTNYDIVTDVNLRLENNGHSVQVDLSNEDLSISHGGLDGVYKAAQFHFHWGSADQRGSEHDINGELFPMEMHIVHYAERFGNASTAMSEDKGLAVLGFLFEVGEHNTHFDEIIQHFDEIRNQDDSTNITSFQLKSLMPDNLEVFYRYSGSLTTPPCYESVVWTIFKETLKVSEDQLNAFRTKIHHELLGGKVPVSDDYRPLQKLNERIVYTNAFSGIYSAGTLVQSSSYILIICALAAFIA
ncbi:hypothetical protein ScPMuIL_007070 [Solemya velum]